MMMQQAAVAELGTLMRKQWQLCLGHSDGSQSRISDSVSSQGTAVVREFDASKAPVDCFADSSGGTPMKGASGDAGVGGTFDAEAAMNPAMDAPQPCKNDASPCLEAIVEKLAQGVLEQQRQQDLQSAALREGLMELQEHRSAIAEVPCLSSQIDKLRELVVLLSAREDKMESHDIAKFDVDSLSRRLEEVTCQCRDLERRMEVEFDARISCIEEVKNQIRQMGNGVASKNDVSELREQVQHLAHLCERQREDMLAAVEAERTARGRVVTDLRATLLEAGHAKHPANGNSEAFDTFRGQFSKALAEVSTRVEERHVAVLQVLESDKATMSIEARFQDHLREATARWHQDGEETKVYFERMVRAAVERSVVLEQRLEATCCAEFAKIQTQVAGLQAAQKKDTVVSSF